MRRWGLLLALVVVPVLLLAQGGVTPSGWATTAGPAVPMAQPGAPLVSTPEINLGTYSPSPVGATNATGNNVAGASNATVGNVPPVAGATQMQVQYSMPYPSVVGAGGQYAPVPVGTTSNGPGGAATGLPYFDRGAERVASIYDSAGPQSEVSLGEMAREFRQKKDAQNARTFTNDDINRIEQQYGPPTGGVSATAVNAGAASSGTETAPAPPPSNLVTNPPPRRSPFEPPANAPQQTGTPPPQQQAMSPDQPPMQPMGQAQEQPARAQSSAAQPEPAQSGAEQSLPGTASHMPTLLLIGGSAVLAGLLLRRRNQRRSGVGF